jgi:hypothetical protein
LKYKNYPYLRGRFEYLPMPKKDLFHDNVRTALEKEGWIITHDPYFIRLGKRKGFIDLGAELLAAERGLDKIAVEIKGFTGMSDVDEFEDALGQFLIYKLALTEKESDRTLFLAVPVNFYKTFFDDSFFVNVVKTYKVFIIVYDQKQNTIIEWIK